MTSWLCCSSLLHSDGLAHPCQAKHGAGGAETRAVVLVFEMLLHDVDRWMQKCSDSVLCPSPQLAPAIVDGFLEEVVLSPVVKRLRIDAQSPGRMGVTGAGCENFHGSELFVVETIDSDREFSGISGNRDFARG
jgi:hypothetical protein